MRRSTASSSSWRSAGIIMRMDRPFASWQQSQRCVQHCGFPEVMTPSRSLPMIASSEESTMAASAAKRDRRRSWTGREANVLPATSQRSVCIVPVRKRSYTTRSTRSTHSFHSLQVQRLPPPRWPTWQTVLGTPAAFRRQIWLSRLPRSIGMCSMVASFCADGASMSEAVSTTPHGGRPVHPF
jgi:hypothetical protein